MDGDRLDCRRRHAPVPAEPCGGWRRAAGCRCRVRRCYPSAAPADQRRVRSASRAAFTRLIHPPSVEREVMMKQLYRVLAYVIAAGVILQAAAIAYAVFGMFEWV